MGRELQHSAEGTHWTKKNHKYIRKEGNRYIYDESNKSNTYRNGGKDSFGTKRAPQAYGKLIDSWTNSKGQKISMRSPYATAQTYSKEHKEANRDQRNQEGLKTSKASKEQISARQYKTEQGIRERSQAERRQNASNGLGARNQEFAKSATRLQNTKRLYKQTGGKAPNEYKVGGMTLKRATPAIPDTAVEKAKAITQQRNKAANGNGARNQEYAKNSTLQRKRTSALNRQGNWRSPNGYEYAKRENDWTSGSPGTISAKRKLAMYQQGSSPFANSSDRINTLGSADRAKRENAYRPHFGKLDSTPHEDRDYSKSVKADRGKTFVNNLKEKFGPMNEKKDQLVKKAKDFFHKIEAKYSEKRYLDKMYDERSGRPKSYTTQHQYKDYSKTYRKGDDPDSLLGPTTGNAGASNLRKGVEAGRKRAGVKNSPGVQGLENNLRNRGYETSHGPSDEIDKNNDTRKGSYRDGAIDINDYSRGWNDLITSDSKQKNEEYRQRIDRSRSRATGSKNELERGTSVGRKRVKNKASRNKSRNYAAKNNR